MNNFIARVFSGLLTVMHVLVAVALVGVLIAALFFNKDYPSFVGSGFVGTLLSVLVVFLIYVVVVGFLATIISINENLNEIKVLLSANSQLPTIPTLVRSYEEPQIKTEPKI
jgi:hypothetical protein